MANYLQITWWNDHDLGDILYQDGYKNIINLDVEVEKPEYNVTLESDLNGDNVEITKFRKWEKVYKFEMWGQEDLVDAFTLMQIHDNVTVTLQSGDVIQVAKHGLRCEVAWEEIGCLAKLTVSFAENYVVASGCEENMSLECYCDDIAGEFKYIIEYANLIGEPDGTIVLAWTFNDIVYYKYTAKLYQFSYAASTWVLLPDPEQYSCYTNLDDDTTWIWDGQFWHKVPGYFYASGLTGGFGVTMTGWILPGTFAIIWYDAGIGWVNAGTFTADEIAAGADIQVVGSGDIPIKMEVYNHSCDYGETDSYTVNIPVPEPMIVEFGLLYNYEAATNADKISSSDSWIVPSEADFIILQNYLSGDGGDMKSTSASYWDAPNTGATNLVKWNGRGSGLRFRTDGTFNQFKFEAFYMTTDINFPPANNALYFILSKDNDSFIGAGQNENTSGYSIRLLKTSTTLLDGEEGTYTGNDGNLYRTICIGTQEWLADNLCETKYRNLDNIPEVTDNATWAALVTGAWCAYNNDHGNI